MFALARFVVRHKVGTTALLALGVFYMMPAEGDMAQQSSSPWALEVGPAQPVASDDAGMIDGVVDTAVDTAVTYLDDAGMNPMAEAEATVDRFDQTAAAMGHANANN